MCNFKYDIEVTKEEVENAMLLPGEYVKKDGKYYIAGPGMLDGYVCPCLEPIGEPYEGN